MKEISEHAWAQIAFLFIQSLTLQSNELNEISADTRDILLASVPPSVIDDLPERGVKIMVDIAVHHMEDEFDKDV
jgi:hypothetical protein